MRLADLRHRDHPDALGGLDRFDQRREDLLERYQSQALSAGACRGGDFEEAVQRDEREWPAVARPVSRA